MAAGSMTLGSPFGHFDVPTVKSAWAPGATEAGHHRESRRKTPVAAAHGVSRARPQAVHTDPERPVEPSHDAGSKFPMSRDITQSGRRESNPHHQLGRLRF
jgi:hypothetical protein